MIGSPKTKEDAQKYRYSVWAGNPKGTPYDESRCAYETWHSHLFFQCSRKPGHGPGNLYCKQHSKMV